MSLADAQNLGILLSDLTWPDLLSAYRIIGCNWHLTATRTAAGKAFEATSRAIPRWIDLDTSRRAPVS